MAPVPHPSRLLITVPPLPFVAISRFVTRLWKPVCLLPDHVRVALVQRVLQASVRVARQVLSQNPTGQILLEAQVQASGMAVRICVHRRALHTASLPQLDIVTGVPQRVELSAATDILCLTSSPSPEP